MRLPALSPTEAVLAAAAATTPQEMHAARMALIATGDGLMHPLDTSLVISGSGTAGRRLLGNARTCAARTRVLEARLRRELEDVDRPDIDLTDLPMGGAR